MIIDIDDNFDNFDNFNNDEINDKKFTEMINKQLKNISTENRLHLSDIKRISQRTNTSLFDPVECSLWNGYITNTSNPNKGIYINFYFRNKKVALHRLLYANFVESLGSHEYIRFTCKNQGKCCNVNHMEKHKFA